MRILTNSPDLAPLGGVELCTEQIGSALARRGHELTVLFARDGELRSAYRDAGVALEQVANFDVRPRHLLGDVRRFADSISAARRIRPDVLWLTRFEQILWAQAVGRSSRTPVVCHLHHGPNYRLTRDMGRGVRHFIAVSHYMRDTWIRRGIRPDRITVVHNAVPPKQYPFGGLEERAAARAALGLPADGFVAAYLGRIVPDKGVDTLVEAWRRLGLAPDEGRLLLAGRQPTDDPAYIAALEAGCDQATVLWRPMQLDPTEAYHAADVIVVPSKWPEPFGRVVIEGLATGRPVLGNRVGAIPEILTGPMDRFLTEPADAESLTGALRALLSWRRDDPDLAHRCADWVDEHFPFDGHIDRIETILRAAAR